MKPILFLFTVITCLTVISCNKVENIQEDNNDLIAQDTYLEIASADNDGILDEILKLNSTWPTTKAIWGEWFLTGNVVISVRDSASIRIITVDFGTDGNIGKDGKKRSGKLIAYITQIKDKNIEQKLKYLDFKVDGNTFNGQMTKNITKQVDANTQLAIINEDIKVLFPGGLKYNHRVSNMTRLYKFGLPTTLDDNFIESFGTSTITNEKGISQSKTILEANVLIFKVVPGEIVKGKATISFGAGKTNVIDYGDGTLDNTATVSNGTKTWTIKLKK